MREVETKAIGTNKRTLLFHVIAQRFAKRPMQKMRCGVIASNRIATFAIDDGGNGLTDFNIAFKNFKTMTNNTGCAIQSFNDAGTASGRRNHSRVANLPT